MLNKRAGFRRFGELRSCLVLTNERSRPTLQKRSDTEQVIRGYSSVFYRADDPTTEYWLWNDIVERIQPGAFDRALKEKHDARGLFNHDPSQLLGRVSSGTCRLSVDATGLLYELVQDNQDPDWIRVARKIDRGDVTGSSFAFIPRKTQWEEETDENGDRLWIRNVVDVDLFDVGPVTWPAYEGSTAGRSQDENKKLPEEVRSLLLERDTALADPDFCAVRMAMIKASS